MTKRSGIGFRAGLLFLLLSACGAVAPRAEEPPIVVASEEAPADEAEKLRRRLKVLEELVTKLQADLEALRRQAQGGGLPSEASIPELETRIDALAAEIARLRAAEGPPPDAGPVKGLGPGASKVYHAKRGLVFGGYGSALYERFTESADNDTASTMVDRADLAEGFFYVGYRFSERLLLNSSVGIEHALVEDAGAGEAAVEFAYVDYEAHDRLGVRGGLLLMPLGWLNEQHEPISYLGLRRPEVEQRILPTTWREVGVGAYGDAGPVVWRAYLVTSLDAAGFTAEDGIREGRQQGSEARASDMALTARVDVRPIRDKSFGDLLVGASAFSGRTEQERPGFPPGRLTLWDLHAQYDWRGIRFRALRVENILSDAGDISLAIDPFSGTAIGERMRGWYLEVGYDVMTNLKRPNQALTPFCRYERLDTQAEAPPRFAADPENDLTAKTCGVAYLPIPQIAIKLEAQNFDNQAHTATDQVNLGVGWSF